MATVLEERSQFDLSEKMNDENSESWNDLVKEQLDRKEKSNPNNIVESVSKFEVILPIDESEVNQKVLDFAIETAKNFSGKLVLLYVTNTFKRALRILGIR